MPRYIDANLLKSRIKIEDVAPALDAMLKALIDHQETANVQEVKCGSWSRASVNICNGTVYHAERRFECSECHRCVENKSDYCPHCGARMDGEGK